MDLPYIVSATGDNYVNLYSPIGVFMQFSIDCTHVETFFLYTVPCEAETNMAIAGMMTCKICFGHRSQHEGIFIDTETPE